ncbi:MAG: Type 1 glutamine amidotransferase-like domain-containing protein [Chitinophagaceae bacterium]|nr:Type 1 glutamine amidotransferase-like domain-containing protein [Oligoflexus sp.]
MVSKPRTIVSGPNAIINTLDVEHRDDANQPGRVTLLDHATGVFFTGGDQFRKTRLLGGTKLDGRLHDLYEKGLVLAGTSAGASMMSSIMIIHGPAYTTDVMTFLVRTLEGTVLASS